MDSVHVQTRRRLFEAAGRGSLLLGLAALPLPQALAAPPPSNLPDLVPAALLTQLEAIAAAVAPNDLRRQNAIVLRMLAALRGQPSRPVPSPNANRVTHFTKVLSRTEDPADKDRGLASEQGSQAFFSTLHNAFHDQPQPGGLTNFDAVDALRKYIGEGVNTPGTNPQHDTLRFTNPLAGLSFDLESLDTHAVFIRDAPAFSSNVTAAEMAELYWMALLRDQPFSALSEQPSGTNPFTQAVDGLKKYSYFNAIGGFTLDRLFRADLRDAKNTARYGFPGVSRGPYVSQFLFLGSEPGVTPPSCTPASADDDTIKFGALRLSLKEVTAVPAKDYLYVADTERSGTSWYAVQNGDASSIGTDQFTAGLHFIAKLRDGATFVHFDRIYQEYLVPAFTILDKVPTLGANIVLGQSAPGVVPAAAVREIIPTPAQRASAFVAEGGAIRDDLLNFGNPYFGAQAQVGFATFGLTQAVGLLAEVTTRAHKAGWFHKWSQLRLRPEEFGGRLHFNQLRSLGYPISAELTGDNPLLSLVAAQNQSAGAAPDTLLLSQAYPEGCPTHPAFPSGHACVAGACVTILKATFNETRTMVPANAVTLPGDDEDHLVRARYQGPLTVGGELNKLANNIIMFRTLAGVHWRSDQLQGLMVGEQIAVQLLLEQSVSFKRGSETISLASEERKPTEGRPSARFTLFSGHAVDIFEGRIMLFDREIVDNNGVYVAGDQSTWGNPDREISWQEFVNTYQGNPEYT